MMDNIDKNNQIVEVDSDYNTTNESKKSLLDVLRTEPDIIADVFSHLNKLRDRLNLGLTCKQMEKIHSSRPQFWQKVWLDLSKAVESSTNPELTRKYVNIKYYIGMCEAEQSPREKLTAIASCISSMKIDLYQQWDFSTKRIDNCNLNFVEMLPLFENLQHLEFDLSGFVYRKLDQYLKTISAVNMKNLRHLKIKADIFAEHSCIDFSSITRLKSLDISRSLDDKLVGERLQAAQSRVMDLIMQQKGLEKLDLRFGGCGFIFDHPFMLGYKLKKFEIIDRENRASFNRQDNLLDFLQSQKPELRSPQFWIRGESSPRMFQYRASIFDLPLETQSFVVVVDPNDDDDSDGSDDGEQSLNITNISYIRSFTSREICRIFQSSAEVNESSVNLFVSVNVKKHHDDWLQFILMKFSNMQSLQIECEMYRTIFEDLPSLIPLQTLSHLKCLKIRVDTICNAMRDVSLPRLTDFEYTYVDNYNNGFTEFEELQKFLGRHKNLTHLNIDLQNFSESQTSQSYMAQHAIEASKLLHFALENLKELMKMEFASVKYLLDLSSVNETRNMIETHTNIGFTLTLCYEFSFKDIGVILMKTADGVTQKEYKSR